MPAPETPSKGLFQDNPLFPLQSRSNDYKSDSDFDPNDVERSSDEDNSHDEHSAKSDDEENEKNVDPQHDQEPTNSASGKYIRLLSSKCFK